MEKPPHPDTVEDSGETGVESAIPDFQGLLATLDKLGAAIEADDPKAQKELMDAMRENVMKQAKKEKDKR